MNDLQSNILLWSIAVVAICCAIRAVVWLADEVLATLWSWGWLNGNGND